ncbi:MAG TPA: hypothetical protein VIM02_15880, partial [Rhizomicrobium sp.]
MVLRHLALMLAAALVLASGGSALAQRTPRAAPVSQDAQTQQLAPPAAAPTTNVDVTQTGGTPEVSGISVVSLFLRADWIVKAVFVLLLLASLWSWTIIINKWLALGTLRRR